MLSQKSAWSWSALFLFLTFTLWGFYLWFSWSSLAEVQAGRDQWKQRVERLAEEQSALLTSELQQLFEDYSSGMKGLVSLFEARDEVYSGAVDDEHEEPVLLLDVIDFLERFQGLLSQQAVISHLSIGSSGDLSFVVETGSYFQASQQMEALRFGFEEESLLTDVEISSVGRQEANEDLAPVFRFLVQAQISPEYFIFQRELTEAEEDAEDAEELITP